VWQLEVGGVDDEGERVRIQLTGDMELVADVTPSAVGDLDLHPGRRVWAAVKATQIDVYPV
jgi:molybdate transport system ATP-binding protein